jgi:hypothetical protein
MKRVARLRVFIGQVKHCWSEAYGNGKLGEIIQFIRGPDGR